MKTETTVGNAYAESAKAYRRAIRRHEFSEPQWRIVDLLLGLSHERGRAEALVPRQAFIGALLRLSKGKVSEEIDFLERANVIEVREHDTGRKGHRPWHVFALCPPGQWRIPPRVKETAELADLERWLEDLDCSQPELIPAPQSLAEAMRETFVENAATSVASTAAVAVSSRVERYGSHGGNFGRVDTVSDGPEVPPEGTLGGCDGGQVHPEGTFRARVDRDRLIESRCSTDRIDHRIDRSSSDYRLYVQEKLFRLIGDGEARGRSRSRWMAACEQMPDVVDELAGVAEDMRRLGRLRNPAAWMNRAVQNAFRERGGTYQATRSSS